MFGQGLSNDFHTSNLNATLISSDSVICKGDSVFLEMKVDSSSISTPSLPSYLPADSVLAHYDFNNGSVVDLSGQGSILQNFGGQFVSDENGVANSALNFDGVSQYAQISLSDTLETGFSVFMRIYNPPNTDATYDRLFGFYNDQLEFSKVGSSISLFFLNY